MREIDIERLEELKIEWDANDGMLTPSELHEFCKLLLSSLEKEKEKLSRQETITGDLATRAESLETLLEKEKERTIIWEKVAETQRERVRELVGAGIGLIENNVIQFHISKTNQYKKLKEVLEEVSKG